MKAAVRYTLPAVSAIVGALIGVGLYSLIQPQEVPAVIEAPLPVKNAEDLQSEIVRAIRRAEPAVVQIADGRKDGLPEWYRFGRANDFRELPSGCGSGFLIRRDGYLVTGFHTVMGMDNICVITSDGKKYPARFAGADPVAGLAVLKISGRRNFPVLHFSDPGERQAGQHCIALGAPFKFSRTATVGVISCLPKSGNSIHVLERCIQTDAVINPGNSGGPLLNIRGEVLGISNFLLSPANGNTGMNFALASELTRAIAEELILNGFIQRPWLGIIAEPMDRQELQKRKLDSGILVRAVAKHSPAEDSLEPGDVIVRAGGRKLYSAYDLQHGILQLGPGRNLELQVWRKNRMLSGMLRLQVSPKNWFLQMKTGDSALLTAL